MLIQPNYIIFNLQNTLIIDNCWTTFHFCNVIKSVIFLLKFFSFKDSSFHFRMVLKSYDLLYLLIVFMKSSSVSDGRLAFLSIIIKVFHIQRKTLWFFYCFSFRYYGIPFPTEEKTLLFIIWFFFSIIIRFLTLKKNKIQNLIDRLALNFKDLLIIFIKRDF